MLISRFILRLLILHYSHTRVSMLNDYPISCAACDNVETLLELWRDKEQTCDAVIYVTKYKIKIQQKYLLHLYTL